MNIDSGTMNSDVQIAGDLLAVPHLLSPAPAHPTTVAGFARLARTIAADRGLWRPLVRYDATTRWYHRLRTGPGYDVWLLSWLPGQGTGRHDHGPSTGVVTVLDGELTEYTGTGAARLRPGTLHVLAPGHVHETVNTGLRPVTSLHVYFPGLSRMPMHDAHPWPAAEAPAAARTTATPTAHAD